MVAADVSRVTRAPFIWRIGYTLLASDTVRRACAIALRTIKAVFGIAAAQAVLERMAAAVVWSGWPRRIHGWVNIRASSFYSEMRRAVSPAAACIARRPPESRAVMRVGVFGAFRGLLSFQSRFFQAKPTCVQLYAYDVEYDGGTALYLESMVDGYRAMRRPHLHRVRLAAPRWRELPNLSSALGRLLPLGRAAVLRGHRKPCRPAHRLRRLDSVRSARYRRSTSRRAVACARAAHRLSWIPLQDQRPSISEWRDEFDGSGFIARVRIHGARS